MFIAVVGEKKSHTHTLSLSLSLPCNFMLTASNCTKQHKTEFYVIIMKVYRRQTVVK
jgi:hypothetical protein